MGKEVSCVPQSSPKSLRAINRYSVRALFAGDDVTDEDAFRALAGKGLGIRIGDEKVKGILYLHQNFENGFVKRNTIFRHCRPPRT